MEDGIIALIEESFGKGKTNIASVSPLTFAFIGDAIYGLIMRTIVVNDGNTASSRLHDKSTKLVSAVAQAKMADKWLEKDILTEEERNIYKRGMNAKPKNKAKNASGYQYHKATGVESLAGYLYLAGRCDRLVELIKIGLDE